MIFVILGTQEVPFDRMLQAVDNLIDECHITDTVIAQVGHTKYVAKNFKTIPFISEQEFQQYVKQASIIITHAGSGALFNAIKWGKKTIAMARLSKYNEMPDDHQTELAKKLSLDGYIVDGTYNLVDAWKKLSTFIPRPNDFKCSIKEELRALFAKS